MIGLNIKLKTRNLDKIKNQIEYIQKYSTLKQDKDFEKYIQNKFLETVNRIAFEELPESELKELYISNNKIRQFEGGFELYNDSFVETETEGYGGKFSIALAFEYGTGIVGQQNPVNGAWEYNVNQHEKGWYYYKNGEFKFTRGFEGYMIYRFTKLEVENNLLRWVNEYTKEVGGVSL